MAIMEALRFSECIPFGFKPGRRAYVSAGGGSGQ